MLLSGQETGTEPQQLRGVGWGALCGALPGAGDILPPQWGEVTLLAGRRKGLVLGAPSRGLGLQLGHLEPGEGRNVYKR